MLYYLLGIIAALVFLLSSVMIYLLIIIRQPHPQNPENFLKDKAQDSGKIRVLCAGDGVTRGNLGADYFMRLQERLGEEEYSFINAGVNFDLSENLLNRLPEIVACNPHIILILVGNNDLHASMTASNQRNYQQFKKLSRPASIEHFEQNLSQIFKVCLSRSPAKVAVFSLPVLGEHLEEQANYLGDQYAAVIERLAQQYGVEYLPLREEQEAFIESVEAYEPEQPYEAGFWLTFKLLIRRFLLGHNVDRITASQGFLFTPDYLHLNSRGADLVADLGEEFIRKHYPPRNQNTPMFYL